MHPLLPATRFIYYDSAQHLNSARRSFVREHTLEVDLRLVPTYLCRVSLSFALCTQCWISTVTAQSLILLYQRLPLRGFGCLFSPIYLPGVLSHPDRLPSSRSLSMYGMTHPISLVVQSDLLP